MDLSKVDQILQGKEGEPFDVMEALQDIQEEYHHLPEEGMKLVSERLKIPIIEVFRLANFYKSFSLKPRGRHLLTVCTGTACHVQGSPNLVEEMKGCLKVELGHTTADHQFTAEAVNCVGACALAPVVIVDSKYQNHMTPKKLRKMVEDIRRKDAEVEQKSEPCQS